MTIHPSAFCNHSVFLPFVVFVILKATSLQTICVFRLRWHRTLIFMSEFCQLVFVIQPWSPYQYSCRFAIKRITRTWLIMFVFVPFSVMNVNNVACTHCCNSILTTTNSVIYVKNLNITMAVLQQLRQQNTSYETCEWYWFASIVQPLATNYLNKS